MFVILLLFTAFVLSVILVRQFMRLQDIELENRAVQEYIDSFSELYDALQEQVEAVRRYRHDLARHIRTLEEMVEMSRSAEEIQPYIQDLKAQYEHLKRQQYCSDDVINAILAIKFRQCEEGNIPFEVSVQNTDYGSIREMDLVGLIENLLDNAIEAQARIPEGEKKGIRFSMKKQELCIRIEAENQIAAEEAADFKFKSRKSNPEEHGIGTRIIETLIERYHGEKCVEVDRDEKVFRKQIVMKEAVTETESKG